MGQLSKKQKFMREILPPATYDPNLPMPDGYRRVADRACAMFEEAEALYRDLWKRGDDTIKERVQLIIMLCETAKEANRRIQDKLRIRPPMPEKKTKKQDEPINYDQLPDEELMRLAGIRARKRAAS